MEDPGAEAILGLLVEQLGVPSAALARCEGARLRFTARVGLDLDEAPMEASPCGAVVQGKCPLVVHDASADERFAHLPLVVDAPRLRFFAGAPLMDSDGHVLGVLFVSSPEPRSLTEREQGLLTRLAGVAGRSVEQGILARSFEQEAKQRVDEAHAAVLHLDERGQVRWASSDAVRLLELQVASSPSVGVAALFVSGPQVEETVLRSIREGVPIRGLEVRPTAFPERPLRLDLDAREERDQTSPIRCTLTDLSAGEDVASQLRRYETLFDFVDLVCTADGRGHFDLVNPAWEALLGWTRKELRDSPFLSLVHPDDVAATVAVTGQLREAGSLARFENRYRRRDGSYLTLSWTAAVVDGVFVAAARDVTQDVAARERLRFSNELHTLIETLQQSYIAHGTTSDAWWRSALTGLIALTGSEYGFIGTVEHDAQGRYLHTKALTDISWDEATRELYRGSQSSGMVFRNLDTLFGRVMVDGATVVANDVAHDPRAAGRPAGHPPLERFLGLACGKGDGLVGIIGLANRKQGYSPELIADLEPAAVFVETTVNGLRNAAQRRLAESRLQAIADTSADAIVSIDDRGTILAVNGAVQRMFGYASGECLGNNISMLMAAPYREAHDGYLARYRETRERHIIGQRRQVMGRRKDGSEIHLELAVAELEVGGARSFTGIIRDITDQVQDERRLRATAAQLAGALEMANAARLEFDPQADAFVLDDAFLKLVGSSVEAIGGYKLPAPEYISRFVHPEDVVAVATELARLDSGGEEHRTCQFEHRFPHVDGREGFLFVRLFGSRETDVKARRFLGVAQDVTVHRREEQVRARMAEQEQLNQALAERIEELDRSRAVSALTSECVELVQRCISVDESLELTQRFLARMYPSANLELYEQLPASEELALRRWEHRFGQGRPQETLEPHQCWAIRTRRVYAMLPGGSRIDCVHVPRDLRDGGHSACVCAPLLSMDRMIGLVCLTLPPAREGAPADRERIARSVAQFETTMQSLGGALSTVSLRESLQRLALVDELTGLPNRRAFVSASQRSMARARRAREQVVVAIFDVDHFKRVNDTWGHDVGDRVLRQLSEVAQQHFRAEDVVGRMGGEEFAVVMAMNAEAAPAGRLDAFRRAVSERCRAGQDPVSVSIGFTLADLESPRTLDQLLRIADEALYEAKSSGRNRVVQRLAPAAAETIRPGEGRP
jgi:diguanylate cyclase (GGDEF)-like protein/PAS domain S-box-containing protein